MVSERRYGAGVIVTERGTGSLGTDRRGVAAGIIGGDKKGAVHTMGTERRAAGVLSVGRRGGADTLSAKRTAGVVIAGRRVTAGTLSDKIRRAAGTMGSEKGVCMYNGYKEKEAPSAWWVKMDIELQVQ